MVTEAKLIEVRTRVEKALQSMKHETIVIPYGAEKLEVTIEKEQYHFDVRTHVNAPYLDALEQAILEFANEKCDAARMKNVLADLRDASELVYYDQRYLVYEPSEEEFERLAVRFNCEAGVRLCPLEADDAARMTRLLRKFFNLYHTRKSEFERGVCTWDVLFKVALQFKTYALLSKRLKVELAKDEAALLSTMKDFKHETLQITKQEKDVSEYDYASITLTSDFVKPTVEEEMKERVLANNPEVAALAPRTVKSSEELAELVVQNMESVNVIFEPDAAVTIAEPGSQESAKLVLADEVFTATAGDPLIEVVDYGENVTFHENTDAPLNMTVFTKRAVEEQQQEALTDEDAQLEAEDDGEEVEEEEMIQDGLFGDISVEKVTRRKMFADSLLIETAFAYHREHGFPYRDMPPAMAMVEIQKLAEMEGKTLIHTAQAYQVADSFHPHRFHAAATDKWAPYDSFHDDKKLRKAIRLELEKAGKPRVFAGGMLSLVNGTQACSNFRPGFASYLYRKYAPDNATVLDTSTGYGGRLIGAVASQKVSKYIGIDPNVPTYQANCRMIQKLSLDTLMEFELINLPAEDVDPEQYREQCDFAFTSPPYFAKERYSNDDTQSWKRYSTGNEWRDGFLKKMLELQFKSLKSDCFAIVNIADVKLKNKTYPLADWTRELGVAVGFKYIETEQFPMMARFGKGSTGEVAIEPVIVFKKEK